MAEQIRPLLADRDQDLDRYQPLAITAIAAIVVTGIFTALVLTLTVVGLLTRKPVLEPALILLDVVGLVLAVIARWQIRNSEGTRAGGKMATWSIWLGIGFGCVYIAYYIGNVMAVHDQAKQFARSWLDTLEKRDYARAFFFTVPAQQRRGRSPEDAAMMYAEGVTALTNQELSRIFDRASGESEIVIEPQGVLEWKQSIEGLAVTVNFLIKSREGEFDIVVPVTGSETPELSGREWHVRTGGQFIKARRLTTYGRLLYELHMNSHQFQMDLLSTKLMSGRQAEMYLDTLPPAERKQKSMEIVLRTVVCARFELAPQPVGGLQPAANLVIRLAPPVQNLGIVYELEKRLPSLFEFKDPPPSHRQVTSAQKAEILPKLLRPGSMQVAMNVPVPELLPVRVQYTPDAIRSVIAVDFVLPQPLNYRSRGQMIAVCKDSALVAKLNDLAKSQWDKNQPVQEERTELLRNQSPNWQVEKIIVNLEQNRDDPRPGGRSPPPPPPR